MKECFNMADNNLPRNVEHQWIQLNPAMIGLENGKLAGATLYLIQKGDIRLVDALIHLEGRDDLRDQHSGTGK